MTRIDTVIEAAYSEETDMTFILEEVYTDDEIKSTEIKGFYYGRPNEKDTKQFYGSLKAEY